MFQFNLVPIPAIKLGLQVVSGLGVSKILGDVVKNNVVITTTTQKVLVGTGSFVLGSMLWEQSSNHIERAVKDAVTWMEKANEELVKKSEESSVAPDIKKNGSE